MPDRHSNLLELFCSSQWALHPTVFDQLQEVLQRHARGEQLERDEVVAAIGRDPDQPHPDDAPATLVGSDLVVPVRGVLARFADQVNGVSQARGRSAESLQQDLLAALADDQVERLVLNIHSPGGMVFGTFETADVVARVAREKPVVAYVDGMAASAALAIAAPATEIVLSSSAAMIGSLGVITAVPIRGEKMREIIDVEVFRSVALKAPGTAGERLSDEQRAAIQTELQAMHQGFEAHVQASRDLTDAQLAAVATGEVFFGADAIRRGLADRVASLAQVLDVAAATIGTDRISETVQTKDGPRQRTRLVPVLRIIPHRSTPSGQGPGTHTSDTTEHTTMDKDELKALLTAHPEHAALIQALDDQGCTKAQAEAAIAAYDRAYSDAQQAHQQELAKRDETIAELRKELDTTKQAAAQAADQAQRLGALGAAAGADAGADHTLGGSGSELYEKLRGQFTSEAGQRDYGAVGFAAFVEGQWLDKKITSAQRDAVLKEHEQATA